MPTILCVGGLRDGDVVEIPVEILNQGRFSLPVVNLHKVVSNYQGRTRSIENYYVHRIIDDNGETFNIATVEPTKPIQTILVCYHQLAQKVHDD